MLAFFCLISSISLSCSLSPKISASVKPTSTSQATKTHQLTATITLTRTATRTPTPHASPTPTTTFTPTFTYTPTATKTASPTPTPTLSEGEALLLQEDIAMQSVNTMSMEINLTTKSGEIPITLRGSGVAERPDKVYISLSLLFQKYEILSLGDDEVYLKTLGSDTWELTSPEQMDLATSLLRNAFSLLDVRDTAISPTLAGIEEVNGVTCRQMTLGIDLPLYLAKRAPIASSQIDLVASRARGELWIGVDDLRIHKLYIEMDIVSQGETVPVNATIEFSGFNEPVVFPEKPSS
jgi:hypothetical protein